MRISLTRDLGLRLLTLYLLFIGPVVIALLAFDALATERLEEDVKTSDLSIARAIAQETNTFLDNALQVVRQLSRYPEVINSDSEAMEKLFQTLMIGHPDINLTYRLGSNGEMLFHYPVGPGTTIGINFSFRDYFTRATSTRNPFFSKGRISPTTKQPVATAVMPIWSENGDFMGMVATNIKLQSFSHTLTRIIADLKSDADFQIVIIDSEGQVIAHSDPQLLLTEMQDVNSDVTNSVLSGISENHIGQNETGKEVLFSYVPIPSVGWGVIVSRSTATAFNTITLMHRWVLFTIAGFIIIGIFFWLALSREVIQPLIKLARYSQRIGPEKSGVNNKKVNIHSLEERDDQIGYLTRSLITMEKSIDARLNELSTLLETSASVTASLDLNTVLDNILEQVERLMDIKMCAIVALDERQNLFKAKAVRGLSKSYMEHLAISPNEPSSVTLRALRTGEPIQIQDTEEDPSYTLLRPRAKAEGYRSILAVPLNTTFSPPSALLVYRPEPHVFTNQEIDLLCNFANHAAMAIENAALFASSDMQLQEQTQRLEALIQSMRDGLILEDLHRNIIYANRRICELVSTPMDEIIGDKLDHVLDRIISLAIDKHKITQSMQGILKEPGQRNIEFAVIIDGSTKFLRLRIFDVNDINGVRIGRGLILQDITQTMEVDRMKSSLVATVSHELRTPLASIKGYVTTLLANDVTWELETQREFLEIISSETDRLSDLVNDLLDMSKIEAGTLIIQKSECDLEDLIDRAVVSSNPQPGNRIVKNIPKDFPSIYADSNRMEVVLRNLIENAAKYSPEHLPITISACVQNGDVIIRVEDKGPGIPEEHNKHIFESFYRVDSSFTRTKPGAGLGLAISQGFIKAHGGEIWLEPVTDGTCIAFSIPNVIEPTQVN
jgi:PAS domain S-box-containing protein